MINRITHGNLYTNKQFASVQPAFKSQDVSQQQPVELTKVPTPTLVAYLSNINKSANDHHIEIQYFNTLSHDKMQAKYANEATKAVNDLSNRAGKVSEDLSWIKELPQEQIKRLDEIYALADSLKQNGESKLGIIGIGGSKHTIENMLSLNGLSDKAVFLSSVTPEDIKSFIDKLGDKKTLAIMVASKSGTTLEPSVGFEQVRKLLGDDFKNYACITDKDESKSKLRKLANENSYKCGIIHDGCGGRFGAFDDHTLTALAYCGMPKEDMKKMLESALKAQTKFMNPDFKSNPALQRAAFNVESIINGKSNQHDYYFGDRFEGTALWNTQMKKESHKSLYKVSADLVGPAFLHNSTESDLDEGNNTSFYTFNSIKNDKSEDYKAYNALLNGSLKAYSERHPVSLIELKDLSPESIGEFVELKHFETLYTGMMLRAIKNPQNEKAATKEKLPEVVQPHVNIYKKEVNKILAS